MIHILVVEDDGDLRLAVCKHLENRGYRVTGCSDVEEAYRVMDVDQCDLIVSDIMLPGKPGLVFAQEVREGDRTIPILFMTALDDFETLRKGYQPGIDEYMVKPINLEELCFRIEALLRRARSASKKRITLGDLKLDEETLTAYIKEEEVPLTLREFRLLFTLLSYPGRPFSRGQLLESYNGLDNESSPRSVDVFIAGLRAKFSSCESFHIETVRGLGYKAVLS